MQEDSYSKWRKTIMPTIKGFSTKKYRDGTQVTPDFIRDKGGLPFIATGWKSEFNSDLVTASVTEAGTKKKTTTVKTTTKKKTTKKKKSSFWG